MHTQCRVQTHFPAFSADVQSLKHIVANIICPNASLCVNFDEVCPGACCTSACSTQVVLQWVLFEQRFGQGASGLLAVRCQTKYSLVA